MRFTAADVERFKNLLSTSEPTHYECKPPPDQLPSSSLDTCYTLYTIDEFDTFLNVLEKNNEHIARYVLTSKHELCFGREGEPGKTTAEHWQMAGSDGMLLAAGNLFVANRKITGLSDQSSCTTGLISLFHTLRTLKDHYISLDTNLDLIESIRDTNDEVISAETYSITRDILLDILTPYPMFEYETDEELFEEDSIFEDGVRKQAHQDTSNAIHTRHPTPHPFGPFGFFYNKQPDDVSITQEMSRPTQKHSDVPETKTTEAVVQTWPLNPP